MIEQLGLSTAALAGFGALIALFVNVGKEFGIVKDGQAQRVSTFLNLIVFIVALVLRLYVPAVSIEGANEAASKALEVGLYIAPLIIQLSASKKTHEVVKGLPVVGKSHS